MNQEPVGGDVNQKRRRGYIYDEARLEREAAIRRGKREADAVAEMDAMPAHFGLCYFIGNLEAGIVKIGHSRDVVGRRNKLSGSSLWPLSILATVVGGDERERHYHHKFASSAIGGEWFEMNPAILAEIARLNGEAAHG